MKVVEEGYLYKIDNVVSGRQTVKFHKAGLVNDTLQEGTNTLELLKVVRSKLNHMVHSDEIDKESYTEAIPLVNKLIKLCQ